MISSLGSSLRSIIPLWLTGSFFSSVASQDNAYYVISTLKPQFLTKKNIYDIEVREKQVKQN